MVSKSAILVQGYGNLRKVVIVDNWPLVDEVRHWKSMMSCLLGKVVHLSVEVAVGARASHYKVYGVEGNICAMCQQLQVGLGALKPFEVLLLILQLYAAELCILNKYI